MGSEIRVLYIAGWGRSGSTILDTILGQVDGLISVGEVKFLWERGLIENRRCGCGEPLRECPFWTKALRSAYGGVPDDGFVRAMNRESARFRTRQLPILLTPHIANWYIRRSSSYQGEIRRLYGGILEAGSAEIVVDSSKFPSYLALLKRTAGLRVDTVHIVRDPRAVAFSWKRNKRDLDNPHGELMPQLHPAATAAYWTVWNAATERIGRASDAYLRIRYEDVVAAPQSSLESILEFAGESGAALPFTGERTVTLGASHTVSGNPIRFKTGEVTIREDSAWTSEMSHADRRWAEIISTPLRNRYGY